MLGRRTRQSQLRSTPRVPRRSRCYPLLRYAVPDAMDDAQAALPAKTLPKSGTYTSCDKVRFMIRVYDDGHADLRSDGIASQDWGNAEVEEALINRFPVR